MELRPRRAKRPRSIEPESDDEGSKVVIVGPPSELERTKKRLEATRAKLARTEATLKSTEATLALKTKALDSFLRPQPVAFDVDDNVACVVMSHVSDFKNRLALAQVGKVWRRASKEAASLPASLDFSRCGGPECTTYAKVDHLLDINGLDKLTEARFMSLLRVDAGSNDTYRVLLGLHHHKAGRYKEAFKCYESALAAGDHRAEYRLDGCYRYGRGVSKNVVMAVKLFEKGDAKGSSCCQYELGRLYELGESVTKDMFKAVEYWKKAARKDSAPAKEKLASLGHRF
jgi:tetratricopeptide (TPR) repeat protein